MNNFAQIDSNSDANNLSRMSKSLQDSEGPMADLYCLPNPAFDSELVTLLFEIERLRANIGTGDTPHETYVELHLLFDTVMSVISARIEGNHTTVYEAIDSSTGDHFFSAEDRINEIRNIRDAAHYIDSLDPNEPITHTLIRELHYRTVADLVREGDPTPGQYRETEVGISGSAHTPPTWVSVHSDMSALLAFANDDFPMNKQMLQIAQAHHRFVWIHPFRNGNGRVSRLFTYAMLRRTIFARRGFSALNPTSVFGNDRAEYIAALESADALTEDGAIQWATFFARGIMEDLKRVTLLQDHDYVSTELIKPTIAALVADRAISSETANVLTTTLERGSVKAGDLADDLPGTPAQRSRAIRELLDQQLLRQSVQGPRFYSLSLSRGPLARRLVRRLDELGFIPKILSGDETA